MLLISRSNELPRVSELLAAGVDCFVVSSFPHLEEFGPILADKVGVPDY